MRNRSSCLIGFSGILVLLGATALLLLCSQSAYAVVGETASAQDLLAGASARIEKYRKADCVVEVVTVAGIPVVGAHVKVDQTRHTFLFGCNVFLWGRVGNERDETTYRTRFAELFNYATLPFYWATYERRRGKPDHARVERIARWCRDEGIATKGHPLAWNYADPAWLPNDSDQIRSLQMSRIDDCVGRFEGLIERWDVVNEATHFDRESFWKRAPKMTRMWQDTGQIAFVQECFQHARKVNPKATLLINDYRTDPAYETLLKKLIDSNGQPIFDVIGIQSHMHGGTWDNRKVWDVTNRFGKFGAPIHFTELTILSGKRGRNPANKERSWESTREGEEAQARDVERVYTMLFSCPPVEAITWWDFADRGAWLGAPAGFLRKDLSPKPAYSRLKKLIKGNWWTRTTARTDSSGQATFRGFLGRYQVTITRRNSEPVVEHIVLEKKAENRLVVVLP